MNQYEKELDEVERQINERKEVAAKQVGTQDDAICQICQKTKFADGIGHKCYYCQLRSCARCGGRTQVKVKPEQKISLPNLANKGQQNGQKTVWACSLCQKKQQILAKTGKWFHKDGGRPTTPTSLSPVTTPTPPFQTPGSFRGSVSQEFRGVPPQVSSSSLSQQLPIPSQQQQQGASSYSLQRQYDNEVDIDSRRYSDADRLPPPSMSQRGIPPPLGRPSAADHSIPVPLPMNQSVPQIRSDSRRPENDISDAQRRREQNLLKQPGVSERRLSTNEGYAADQRDYGPRADLNRKYSEMQPVRHQASLQRRLSGDRRMFDDADRTSFDQQRTPYPTQGPNGRANEEYNRYNGTGHQTPAGYDDRRLPGDLEPQPARDDRVYDRIPDRVSRPVALEDRRYRGNENETRTKENGYPPRQVSSPDQRMQQPRKQLSPQRAMAIQDSGYDAGNPQTSSFDRNRRSSFRGENTLRPNESTWDAPREYDSGVGRASRNDEFVPETDHDRRHRSISYSYHAENQPRMPYDERNRNRSFRRPSSQDREAERRDWDKNYGRNQQVFRSKDTYPENDDR
uniref:FYVE-type domain-containing protein n=1 Tax=Romanomermis culicivorax TaxID=13658 RepID=A0A915K7Q8_ROMCU